jgi:serine/threonine protein kinase/Tol biopolymer transport system component
VTLAAGARIGPYEVVSLLGQGGMGEVYRARDAKLHRDVALKVLPEALAHDSERLARFEREARTLAALNHPNIAHIYGLEESDGVKALVLELVEGPTLADRVTHGPIPVEEALLIARQMAEALEAAHEQGIVHRDLKPANIKVREDGTVKVLDFGLAKAMESPASSPNVSQSPTIMTPAMTHVGMILGTVAYMSPEQARGKAVGSRADIWAFGCVLYEMLTARRAFPGEDMAEVLGAVVRLEPDWNALPAAVPPPIRSLLEGCLTKDVGHRIPNLSVARFVIDRSKAWSREPTSSSRPLAGPVRFGAWTNALLGTAILASGVAAGFLLGMRPFSEVSRPSVVQFEVFPPPGVTLSPSPVASTAQLALSSDGRRLAFVAAARRSAPQIWIRALDSMEAKPLSGTEGAAFPFWSPDGGSLAFFAGGKLKKIDIAGGAPLVLGDAVGRGGTWNAEGIIVFAGQPNSVLFSVTASGGPVRPIMSLGPDDVGQNWPLFLPDGRHFLFYQRSNNPERQGAYVATLDSPTPTLVLRTDAMPIYASGFLGSVRDGTLFVQAFDEPTLRTTGPPIRVGDNVGYFPGTFGFVAAAMSPAGVLAYGPSVRLTTSLRWRDRTGAMTQVLGAPDVYTSPRLSPDERTVASAVGGATGADIWLMDVTRGTSSRGTFEPLADWFPAWSADGNGVFFGTTRGRNVTSIYQKVGSGPDEPILAKTQMASYPNDASRDGRFLAFMQSTSKGYDVAVLDVSADRRVTQFLSTPFHEVQARFSPNGRWIAYASDESGQFEVYVRPFPTGSAQWKISNTGGMQPEWRRDGKELFYISADGKMMAVPVMTDAPTFDTSSPTALFDVEVPQPNPPYPNDYAVSADGRRFLVNTVIDQPTRQALTVILNWTETLRQPAVK